MERTKYIFIVLVSFIVLPSMGQNNKTIFQAYLGGDMDKWKIVLDSLEAVSYKTNNDKLEIINYHYGYIAWCIDKEKNNEAEDYIKKAEGYIRQLERLEFKLSHLYAYKAALIGYKIGISPFKAPFIGAESLNYAKQSVDIDPTNALGHIQLGNIAFYTPAIFGGSREEAIEHYLKALGLMEEQSNNEHNWILLNLLATIINTYIDLEQYEQANYYCLKVISIEPGFDWINNTVYPQVQKLLKDGAIM